MTDDPIASGSAVKPLSTLSRIAAGRTAEVYAWEPGIVLKLFYEWVPREWVVQEARASRRVAEAGIASPKPLREVALEGRYAILYERVDGASMLREIARRPWRVPMLARWFAELHHAVHQQSGLGLPPLRETLWSTIESVDVLAAPARAAVLRSLEALPDGDALCHFDFHPDQVLLVEGRPVVIDWMTARRGAAAADVARTAVIFMVARAPFPRNRLEKAIVNAGKNSFARSYLRRYRRLEPTIGAHEIERWMLPIAAARLREDIEPERGPLLEFIRTNAGHASD